jgi:chemotaxis protein CheZ
MMIGVEKEDLEDLTELLAKVSEAAALLTDDGNKPEHMETIRQGLKSFHTTAAMLGLESVERCGIALQDFFTSKISTIEAVDAGLVLSFVSAVKAIKTEMKSFSSDNAEHVFDVDRIIEILYSIPEPLTQDEVAGELTEDELPPGFFSASESGESQTDDELADSASADSILMHHGEEDQIDFSELRRITESLDGQLLVESNGSGGVFQLSFPLSQAKILKVQHLLSSPDLNVTFGSELGQQDGRLEKVLNVFQSFVLSFSSGDMIAAREILLNLSEQQQQAGLYKQVGVLARQLHDSLKSFGDSIDPDLVNMVEDKIPDSGSRLEHILRLTERAANTTLDHVEAMQKRNQMEQTTLARLKELLASMRAVGDKAQGLIVEAKESLDELKDSVIKTSADLITVSTAQDYQDITGQIILKIIALLKDLESNLVNVIRTFGVRPEGHKESVPEELYGPVHDGVATAMHSQDDVDSLLAEFGF